MPQEITEQIIIVGGGPTGLSLALALKRGGLDPLLLDAREPGAAGRDPRVLALSPGTRQTLERLDAWRGLNPTPIETIHISQRGGFGRTRLEAKDYAMPALGYVEEAGALARILEAACLSAGVRMRHDTRVTPLEGSPLAARLRLESAGQVEEVQAALVCWAEGRLEDGPDVTKQDYGQHGVITVVKTLEGRGRIAYERFTPEGPLAILPKGDGYAVVFTASPDGARAILALSDADFLARLQDQFGERLHFIAAEPRLAYPLILRYRSQPIGVRQAWLGNSAQALHPVGGQGFNLALRDAWTLGDQILRRGRDDPGAPALLAGYAGRRDLDRRSTIRFTDFLVRVFSNDNPLLAGARGAGLMFLDTFPPARDFVARRMMYGARAWP